MEVCLNLDSIGDKENQQLTENIYRKVRRKLRYADEKANEAEIQDHNK